MGPEKAGRLATSIPREEECQENQGVARLSSYSAQGVSCRKAMRRQSNSTSTGGRDQPRRGNGSFLHAPSCNLRGEEWSRLEGWPRKAKHVAPHPARLPHPVTF